MQCFGAMLKFDLHCFAFNGIAQTILVAFSMKMSRACSGTLSSGNDNFKFFKTAKKINARASQFQGSWNCFISRNQFVLDQKHERNSSQRDELYIFQNIEISMLVTFH